MDEGEEASLDECSTNVDQRNNNANQKGQKRGVSQKNNNATISSAKRAKTNLSENQDQGKTDDEDGEYSDEEAHSDTDISKKIEQEEDSFSAVQNMLERGECYVDENGIICKGKRPRKSGTRGEFEENEVERKKQQQTASKNLKAGEIKDHWDGETSEVTIYKNAVDKATSKDRTSSSSDEVEPFNSSDETLDLSPENQLNLLKQRMRQANLDHLIPDSDKFYDRRPQPTSSRNHDNRSRSRDREDRQHVQDRRDRDRTDRRDAHYDRNDRDHGYYREARQASPEERAEDIIRQAEASKARMLEVPGLDSLNIGYSKNRQQLLHSVFADEEFSVVAAHVDENTVRRIENNMFVDFVKLLPRDKIVTEDEPTGLRLINRGGEIGVAPAVDKDLGNINSYSVWNQAFCVFTHIYTNKYAYKATELT